MARSGAAISLFWLAFGITATGLSLQLDIGTATVPGPGFVPFWTGILLTIFAAALVVRAVASPGAEGEVQWRSLLHRRVLICLATLVAYLAVLEWIGFFLASSALLFVLFGLLERMSWPARTAWAVGTSAVFWLLFRWLLGLELPIGLIFGGP